MKYLIFIGYYFGIDYICLHTSDFFLIFISSWVLSYFVFVLLTEIGRIQGEVYGHSRAKSN